MRSIEVLLTEWGPASAWRGTLQCLLASSFEAGAAAAWCADELGTPSVLDLGPERATAEAYAAFAPSLGLVCNSGLDEEYAPLDDDQQRSLATC